MELIRISDRKLKIMLTPTDMCQFEINADNFENNTRQMHRSFRLLLAEIHRQTGFEADDSHLSVQYFPSREGGCEMFICNLRHEDETPPMAALSPPEKRDLQLHPIKKNSGSFRRECAYCFSELEHLLSVCRRLLEIGYVCESAAWRDEKGCYYLFMTLLSGSPFSTPEELDFILEYGSIENAALLRLYIREHAKSICSENAICELARLG